MSSYMMSNNELVDMDIESGLGVSHGVGYVKFAVVGRFSQRIYATANDVWEAREIINNMDLTEFYDDQPTEPYVSYWQDEEPEPEPKTLLGKIWKNIVIGFCGK